MNSKSPLTAEITAWFATALVLLLLLYLHLLPALLGGLVVFSLVNFLISLLKNRMLWGMGRACWLFRSSQQQLSA